MAMGWGTDHEENCRLIGMTATAYGMREGQPSCRGMRTKVDCSLSAVYWTDSAPGLLSTPPARRQVLLLHHAIPAKVVVKPGPK